MCGRCWKPKIYIHELGGLVVADEIQCGMGRTGKSFWAFQSNEGVIPDILTVGKPMGNGYPIGAVITTREIASTVKNTETVYCCDPVGASIGLAVLKVMKTNRLMENAVNMGRLLVDGFMVLKQNHQYIGDVRGRGLIVAVDIVRSKESTKPAPEIAEEISNKMRSEKILVGCDGEYKNILLFLPALCITEEDCQQTIRTLDTILTGIEVSNSEDMHNLINAPQNPGPSTSSSSRSQYIPTYQTNNMYQEWASDDSELQNPYDALD